MRIQLSDGSRNETLQFDPDRHRWIAPKPNECRCAIATKLPPPFDRLFLKRYRGEKAPAHALITAAIGNRLPASTPRIYGWGQYGSDYLYVFEYLTPEDYQTLNALLGTPGGKSFMTTDLLLRVARQAESLFSAIGRTPFEHLFTDFCTKNLMYNPKTGGLVIIDLDSAWSFALLHEHENKPIGDKFDIHFWTFWLDFDLAKRSHQHHHLPRMMVLSFAAAFGRALGLLNHPEQPEAKPLLLIPASFEQIKQDPLWEALAARDEVRFRDFFLLPPRRSSRDDLFEKWLAVFEELTESTAYVPWTRVREAVSGLAKAHKKTTQPAISFSFPRLPDIRMGIAGGVLGLLVFIVTASPWLPINTLQPPAPLQPRQAAPLQRSSHESAPATAPAQTGEVCTMVLMQTNGTYLLRVYALGREDTQKVRYDLTIDRPSGSQEEHFIVRSGWFYRWRSWDPSWDNRPIKMPMRYSGDFKKYSIDRAGNDLSQKNLDCQTAEIENTSIFDPPANITFIPVNR